MSRSELKSRASAAADAILLAVAAAALLLLVYWIARGGSDWRTLARPQSLAITGSLMVIAIGLVICLRLTGRAKLAAITIALAVISSMYAAELVLAVSAATGLGIHRPVLPLPAGASQQAKAAARAFASKFGVDFDTRDRLEFVRDLRRQHPGAQLTMAPDWLFVGDGRGGLRSTLTVAGAELHPIGGVSRTLTVLCNESGSWVTFESDEHGFRNPSGIWSSKIDIAAVGDSFAEGECVPSDKNFVSLIRDGFPGTLNLGMRGSGPLLELAQLQEYLPALKPRVVLWFYYEGNDLTNLEVEKQSPLMRQYLDNGFRQNLVERQKDIDDALGERVRTLEAQELDRRESHSRPLTAADVVLTLKLTALRRRLGLLNDSFQPDFRLLKAVLLHAKVTTESWGGMLYFVYLPSWSSLVPPSRAMEVEIPSEVDIRERDRILTVVHELKIPLVDLLPVLKGQPNPAALFPFGQWGHYNEAGNRVVADTLFKEVLHCAAPPACHGA
jgi:hypothetical protein